MTVLEKKVDAIASYLLAGGHVQRNKALAELERLMETAAGDHRAKSIAEHIDGILLDLGVPENILGFGYLQTAISAAVDEPRMLERITSALYPAVAKVHGTTKTRAERAIRHAIECGWDRCDIDMQEKYFGGKISPTKGKPANGEFIARCANIIRRKIAE